MSLLDPTPYADDEPRLATRRSPEERHDPAGMSAVLPPAEARRPRGGGVSRMRVAKGLSIAVLLLAVLAVAGVFYARYWVRAAVHDSLPQVEGAVAVAGIVAPVTVERDAHGVPHIQAHSLDDLVFAQAFVTTGDRLFQMDTLRRHAAGELAEILGPALVPHDKLQRTLQIRAAAERAVAALPSDQLHLLEVYARGVNASMAQQAGHLPIEFRVLRYQPAAWTPRDSILVSLAMIQDLTDQHPSKLAHEALTAELTAAGAQGLIGDLFPTSTWRDHPPAAPQPDLTIPGPPVEQVPLDESQAQLGLPVLPSRDANRASGDACFSCFPGSNNWVVSGAHTASGKPLLSNDMHLTHSLPGIWYEADLTAPLAGSAEPLHVAGVTIPGLPLIVVGHNAHVAWGFTNLGADVEDIYIETTRGAGDAAEFQAVDGTWQPMLHLAETIKVNRGRDVKMDVAATRHGGTITPILTPMLRHETRQLALRWTAYEPGVIQVPVLAIATAHDWPSFLAAFAQFGGPAQNVVYADDQGHIGYHAVGRVPLRGPAPAPRPLPSDVANPVASAPTGDFASVANDPDPLNSGTIETAPAVDKPQLSGPLSEVPLVPSAAHEWAGYIPFEQMPQVYDPPSGVIATANARVTTNDFPYPVTLNWGAPYRNERIWHLLLHRNGLTAADMLSIETDVYSDFDHVLGQRLAYALDHSAALAGKAYKPEQAATLHEAADLLRNWNGRMTTDSAAAAVVASTHAALWPMLLGPHLKPADRDAGDVFEIYQWYSHDFALEQLLMHTPPRWLPAGFANWDDFLTAAVAHGLADAKAPADLGKWRYGAIHTLEIEHPIFHQSAALRRLLGKPTGTGPMAQSGDGETVKQVGRTFGPSERFTADLGDLDHSTLNLVLGQSGNPESPWFMDQFPAWYHGTTFAMPFSRAAAEQATTHTLTLTPR